MNDTLEISKNIASTMLGKDDRNFKRIHHYSHHILLHIKDHLMKENCKNYFEIGTHFGHSLCTVLQSDYESKFVSCDLFSVGGTIATDCAIRDVEKLANDNVKLFNKHNYDCKIIRGNSHAPSTVEKVKSLLPEGIDLLFVDGDHRGNAVHKDFESYFPLVNPGGYIVFDDYYPRVYRGNSRECPKAVDSLVNKYKNQLEIIGDAKDHYESDNLDFIVRKI